jgi:Raf kinase inhibitor-like YbhB/YbcL family protein
MILFGVFFLFASFLMNAQEVYSMEFKITSQAFSASQKIPPKYTCDGEDVSPDLEWSGAPANTKSFALIVDDPDAPSGSFNHWVLYGLAGNISKLPEGLPRQPEVTEPVCKQGISDFGRPGYGGPCPPSGAHRYFFKLYALDTELSLSPKFRKRDLDNAIKGHVLAHAELMGTYQRK